MSRKTSKRSQRGRKPNSPILPAAIALAGVLLVGAAVLLAIRGPQAKPAVEVTGAPKLKVDKERVDLGDVRLGQTVEVSFEVANVGDRQLRFSEMPWVEVVEGC